MHEYRSHFNLKNYNSQDIKIESSLLKYSIDPKAVVVMMKTEMVVKLLSSGMYRGWRKKILRQADQYSIRYRKANDQKIWTCFSENDPSEFVVTKSQRQITCDCELFF